MSLAASIDPGKHVGFALWDLAGDDGPECVWAVEFTIAEAEDEIYSRVAYNRPVRDVVTHIYIEEFRLRGGRDALQQQGSDFPASRLIGSLQFIGRTFRVPVTLVSPGVRAAALERATALGITWPSYGHGGHAKDAVAVGIAGMQLRAQDLRKPHWHPVD